MTDLFSVFLTMPQSLNDMHFLTIVHTHTKTPLYTNIVFSHLFYIGISLTLPLSPYRYIAVFSYTTPILLFSNSSFTLPIYAFFLTCVTLTSSNAMSFPYSHHICEKESINVSLLFSPSQCVFIFCISFPISLSITLFIWMIYCSCIRTFYLNNNCSFIHIPFHLNDKYFALLVSIQYFIWVIATLLFFYPLIQIIFHWDDRYLVLVISITYFIWMLDT